MDLLNEHYLWASLIWGAIASGYLIYGWRQKEMVPLLGGLAMSVAAIFIGSALVMSVACAAIALAIWCLLKQGY